MGHKCPSRAQQSCERVWSASTGASGTTLLCLSIFHLLIFDTVTQPIHERLACSSSPASAPTSTALWLVLFLISSNKEYLWDALDRHLIQKLVWLRKQKRNSAFLVYLIWFIKQACESEVLLGSTHVHHCFLQRAKHSCPNVLTGSMPSSTIKCCQLWTLSHTGDSPNPAGTQLPAELWACCSPLPEGFCPGFLSSHLLPHNTSPAAPPTGLLDLWHTTNCSKLSFPQCIPGVRQCFIKAILCKTNVLKKKKTWHGRNCKEAGRGRDSLWGCPYAQTMELTESHWPRTVTVVHWRSWKMMGKESSNGLFNQA